ncbi:ABC transporter ATP-binding protein [Methylocystis heyeri]|uniref:ATP-binding cassette domain-containing protein n=1 Tax=Methylocystis heyeri TaxID=391905 RepID=A0A6B8KKX8_9HYPH|nr:ABC transporter ATP-binding protein [Methylocystis heyeri]QGM47801.1 ATP-binding cassette domain-containing protein [Methylocystis heyeri]
MTTQPLLSVEHISKRFGPVAALEDVSLSVGAGEFFALLGPSGCGKTTLMRLIAGFETPDSGQALLSGRDLFGIPPHRRPINMMFQSYALFPHLNVFENVAFGLRRRGGAGREEISARVDHLLEIVQLQGFGGRKIDQLSGGQKQRVALARALAPGPSLLLLDEPLGALDRKLREETQFQLKDIQRRLKTSFVIVTHDQDEALALADRIAVMRAGAVEQIGSPVEIYQKPASRFVASFVGATNMIEGRISRDGDAVYFEAPFGRLERRGCALPGGAPAALSLRPEQIVVQREGEGVRGVIEDVAFRGETTRLRVGVGGGEALNVSSSKGMVFSLGEAVRLAIAPDAGALFPGSE